GLGVVWTVQLVPFHRSARDSRDPPLLTSPTAVQAFGPVQDTPLRLLFDGFGMVPRVQALPFQVSTIALKTLPLSSSPPTAAQKLTAKAPPVGHDTDPRLLAIAGGGMAGGCCSHLRVQFSASVRLPSTGSW